MSSPNARKYFPKPGMFKKISQIFLFLWAFLRILTNICIKRMQISSEIGFYDAKYQTSRTIFAAARKNTFGKVVTLVDELELGLVGV